MNDERSYRKLEIQSYVKKYWFVGVIVVLVVFLLFDVGAQNESELVSVEIEDESVKSDQGTPSQESEEVVIYVDVKGAVNQPGVYPLIENDRTLQAIEKAGGFTNEADVNQVNLAAKVKDGTVIYVPKVGEVQNQPVGRESSEKEETVNINTASVEELQKIDGIGPSKAKAIINYRDENGPFSSIEEIQNVSGIGEKSFERMKNEISVD